ncbi:MAG: PKD domain-containing protein [Halobacteriota archaeon]
MQKYSNNTSPSTSDISTDPLFAEPINNNFHLKSTGGHWNGSTWVIDFESSPCIDAGDPASDYSNEPEPNGGRLNIGAYGNTKEASKSPPPTIRSSYPQSRVRDAAGATRTFNITLNQIVNVSWHINGTEVQTNESVTEAAYTHTSAANGTWNVSVAVSNPNGTAIQTWTWKVGTNQQPVASYSYSPGNPVINQMITFNAANSTDPDGTIINYEWNFGDGNVTNTTEPIITHSYASAGTYTVNLTVTDDEDATNATTKCVNISIFGIDLSCNFDTGSGTYPSISGTHTGTITPNQTITVQKLYTYPCAGTGGHTEYVRLWNSTLNVTATGNGYTGDWRNISFLEPFTLVANETYNYTIRTGSYPQIIHNQTFTNEYGTITSTKFTDANGRVYYDWIPAIRME